MGPPDWKDYTQRSYSDNFVHEEKYYDEDSGGVYLKTQISFRVGCTTPGSGSQCLIQIDELHECNGRSCGSEKLLNNNDAIATLPNPGNGTGKVMPPSNAVII